MGQVRSGVLPVNPVSEMIGEKTHLTVFGFEFAYYTVGLRPVYLKNGKLPRLKRINPSSSATFVLVSK